MVFIGRQFQVTCQGKSSLRKKFEKIVTRHEANKFIQIKLENI